jgi:hypothetical protein
MSPPAPLDPRQRIPRAESVAFDPRLRNQRPPRAESVASDPRLRNPRAESVASDPRLRNPRAGPVTSDPCLRNARAESVASDPCPRAESVAPYPRPRGYDARRERLAGPARVADELRTGVRSRVALTQSSSSRRHRDHPDPPLPNRALQPMASVPRPLRGLAPESTTERRRSAYCRESLARSRRRDSATGNVDLPRWGSGDSVRDVDLPPHRQRDRERATSSRRSRRGLL